MNKIKPFIIFRKDGFYNDLNEYIKLINIPTEIEIHIFIDAPINLEKHDYNIEQIEINDDNTIEIRKNIYNRLENDDIAVIYDTYFKFTDNVVNISKVTDTSFILLETNHENIALPYLFSYNNCDNADIETFSQLTYYDNGDIIAGSVSTHPQFINSLLDNESSDIDSIIYRFSFGDENLYLKDDEYSFSNMEDMIYPRYVKLFNYQECLYNDEKNNVATNIIENYNEFIISYYIFDKVFTSQEIVDIPLLCGLTTHKPCQNLLYYTGNIDELFIKYIYHFETYYKSKFINSLPDWIDKKLIPTELIDKYLPEIHLSKEQLNTNLDEIIGFEEYCINGIKVEKTNNEFHFNKNCFELFSPINYNDKLLIATSYSPFMVHYIKDGNLVQIFNTNKNLENVTIFGNIVKFLTDYVCLAKIREGCFKFLIFQDKTLEPKGESKEFHIKDPIGLINQEDELYIVTKTDKLFYKCKIDLIKYFTDLCPVHNIESVFEMNIRNRNNIELIINNYDNILQESNGLRFNCDEDSCAKVEYLYDKKIIKYDERIYFLNRFIYLPSNNKIVNKTSTVYFMNKSPELNLLRAKFEDLSITEGDNYETSKYCFIMQSEFERLDNLTVSKIIDSNTIIVSLITKDQLDGNNFIKKYTTDTTLQKLFLFNIGMNDNYLEFIIEKIILDEQYDKRKQFMSIDKENIFQNSNIYQIIKQIKEDKFTKKIDETNSSLNKKIKKRYFDNDSSFNNLVNFIINKEFDVEIRHLNTSIPESLKKLNMFGTNKSINEDSANFDIVVLATIDDLKNVEVSNKDAFFYINDINKILMT